MPACGASPRGNGLRVGAKCNGALRCLEGVPHAAAASLPSEGTTGGKHVMVSYQWGSQDVVVRIVASMKQRGFAMWFDLEAMSGSTLDAMAGAVEGASCALLCMSSRYKASANCRLEGNYVHEMGVPFVPLLLEEDYQPSGAPVPIPRAVHSCGTRVQMS